MTIGDRISMLFTTSDFNYAFRATATAADNVATLTHSTGEVVQTTGSPTILDGDGKDWEGVNLPVSTASVVYFVAIVAGSANTGTVACVGADLAESPSGTLRAGGLLLLAQPAATAVGSGSTLGLTFSASGDTATVYVFAYAD